MTLSGLHRKFLRYCEVERRLAPQTVIAYRSDFLQFLEFLQQRFRWGLVSHDTLATLSMENIRDYQYYMAQHGWSTATVHRRLVSLNRFAGWLVRRGYLRENPLSEIEFPRKPRHLPRVLAWPDVEAAIAAEPRARDRAILSLLAYAGLRRGEPPILRVGDFSCAGMTIHVRGKGNKDRVIGLPRPACETLVTYLDRRPMAKGEAPLFVTAYGGPMTHKVVSRAVWRAGQRLGQRVHPHMFRHSYATELLERGADIRDIRDLLGHESVATTEIYTHVSAARMRRVVSLLDGSVAARGYVPPGRRAAGVPGDGKPASEFCARAQERTYGPPGRSSSTAGG